MKKKKEERARHQESYRLIDIGDHMDRVHPITEGTLGQANVSLLNNLEYDYVTLGNNEGITFSEKELFHLYDRANFTVVCSNLNYLEGDNPAWLKAVSTETLDSGIKIGYIGLTATFNPYYNLLGWHAEDIYETLEKQLAYLSDQVDIIILLSHVGINEDREIAKRFKEIDVIIGGHTHHLLRTGEKVNETLLTAAGKFSAYVGQVILTYDHEKKSLIKKQAYTTDITELKEDKATVLLLESLETKSNSRLNRPLTTIAEAIKINWDESSKLMQELTRYIRKKYQVDIAFLNSGLILEDFTKGIITYKDVHQRCPHPINLVIVELTGYELLEVIRASFTKEFINLQLRGFGFRGDRLGYMEYSGIDLLKKKHSSGEYIKEVYYKGELLNKQKTYSVITADVFTFGRILPEVARSERKELILPNFIRSDLAEMLQINYVERDKK